MMPAKLCLMFSPSIKLPHKLKPFQQKDDKNIFLEPRQRLFAVKKFYDKSHLQMFKSTIYEMLLHSNSH